MNAWSNLFNERWAKNYYNHLNGRSPAQTALEPHVAALGEIYQAQRPFPGHGAVADFAIPGRMLIIELDGPEHRRKANRLKDDARDEKLARSGWQTIRLTNAEVLEDAAAAMAKVLRMHKENEGQF